MGVGQLFFTGIKGTSLDESEREFIENSEIGGVILFERNVDSAAQLAELINSIQILRQNYPLFIGIDHEGGRVHRLKDHFTHFPAMQEIGKLNSPKIIYHVYKYMAQELSAVGVNLNFAPVCDILMQEKNIVIGDRSFGHSKELVEKNISGAIRGLQTNSVMACAKHFPGHGSTVKDSHFDLPHLTKTLKELEAFELDPFTKAAKARVNFMMVAHMVVDAFDPNLPCSLSPKCYEYIRKKLKYSRPVITDDLSMKAITKTMSIEDASVVALNAGADILLFQNIEEAQSSYARVSDAIKVKEILKVKIDEKLKRVEATKKEFFTDFKPVYIPSVKDSVKTKQIAGFVKDILSKISE